MAALLEINTDGLAKLAETISFALGGTARGERKMADAKAYAAELEAKTKNKVALIEAQGLDALANYVAAKEIRKLKNTVAVIDKAQAHFTDGEKVSDEPVDEGWKNRFFNIIEEVTDEDMREIWGRVLAGEVKRPKSYSLRTLDTLRNMTKDEASLIVKIAPFALYEEYIYRDCSLTIDESLTLKDCGILLDDGHRIKIGFDVKPKEQHALVLDEKFTLVLHNDNDTTITCNVFIYKLTTAGKEIVKLVNVENERREQFVKSLINNLYSQGFSKICKHSIINVQKDNVEFQDEGILYENN